MRSLAVLSVALASALLATGCQPQAGDSSAQAAKKADAQTAEAPVRPGTVAAATPQLVIAAFERNFGVHPGLRRNHAKGVCATGEFRGDPKMQEWSRSALFAGEPVPVIARFSLPGGNPEASDSSIAPRGMALEFRPAHGGLQHMTMLNVPVFSAATPDSFYAGLLAATPAPATGKPDPERQRAFREAHSDSEPLARFMAGYRPPVGYGRAAYYGIHAFRFVDAEGRTTPVRWRFEPEDGGQPLSPEELASAPADFLAEALAKRVAEGPLRWRMIVAFGEPGDPTNDPTLAWPEGRRELEAGVLALTAAGAAAGDECETLNFDPMVMAPGIEPGDDPVLAFRSAAYALSFARRMMERMEANGGE